MKHKLTNKEYFDMQTICSRADFYQSQVDETLPLTLSLILSVRLQVEPSSLPVAVVEWIIHHI